MKKQLQINVLEAAKQRISWTFDTCKKIYVSFSGGKDSTVLLHLVIDEAIKRNIKVAVLFIDWEVQYNLTIEFVELCFNMYKDHIEPYWICLPLLTTNSCSQFEPEWTCWDIDKKDLWVRDIHKLSIHDKNKFPFYYNSMTFEEFVIEFGKWYSNNELTAGLIGIRTQESLNRFRTINSEHKKCLENKKWTTVCTNNLIYAYPIYDWTANDDWIYFSKFKKQYNKIYDLMYYAGLTVNQMRICEPYGYEQKKGLWLYHLLEPELWNKAVLRVNGANTGALYSNEPGIIMGNNKFNKPENHSWQSFAMLLLNTMPTKTSEHYKNKIAIWIKWYNKKNIEIQDELPKDTGSKDMPSWRRICKVLLKNDYWCRNLNFSPTKMSNYENYIKSIQKKRELWNII